MIPGEDEETNPLRYGKSIANWISDGLNAVGFSTVVNPEDWGWRIDCVSEPYPVWIGCGNMEEDDGQGNFKEPDINNLTWQCFVSADKPFFKSLFKKLDANANGSLSLEEFKNSPRLKNADEEKINKHFKKLDTNGNGSLTLEEFTSKKEDSLKKRFESIDTDGNGNIDFSEYKAFAKKTGKRRKKGARKRKQD